MKKIKSDRFLSAARIIGILYILIWLIYILFQTTEGDMRSLLSILPAGIMLLLMLVANQKPILGGILLIIAGIALAIRYGGYMQEASQQLMIAFLTGGPYIIVGGFFLLSGLKHKLIATETNR